MTLATIDNDIKGFAAEEDQSKLFLEVRSIIDANQNKAGAVIRILQQCQELCGYLPVPIVEVISQELDIPLSELYGIITFYHFFTLVPRGKYTIQVCKGTACYVKGGQRILDTLKRDYNLEPGGITEDGRFSLEIVRCLGACGLSPVIAINNEVHGRVKASALPDILASYE